jgi:hypothetical protein
VLSVSPMFCTGFESLNSVDGLWWENNYRKLFLSTFFVGDKSCEVSCI